MRKIRLWIGITMLCWATVCGAYDIVVGWNQYNDPTISYDVYAGATSGHYTQTYHAGVTNQFTITGLNISPIYLSAVTVRGTNTSELAPEIVYYNTTSKSYVGVRFDYGTSLVNLTSQRFQVKVFTNPPPNQGYRSVIIQTNHPFAGSTVPYGTNYTYFGIRLDYGTNLSSLTTETIGFFYLANPPQGELYRGSLIVTNNPIN